MTLTRSTVLWSLLTLSVSVGCFRATEPRTHMANDECDPTMFLCGAGGGSGSPAPDTLRLQASCAGWTAWQFDIDYTGNTYTTAGQSWGLAPGTVMKIPATSGTHWMDMTRWSPTVSDRTDSVTTGVLYQLPCP